MYRICFLAQTMSRTILEFLPNPRLRRQMLANSRSKWRASKLIHFYTCLAHIQWSWICLQTRRGFTISKSWNWVTAKLNWAEHTQSVSIEAPPTNLPPCLWMSKWAIFGTRGACWTTTTRGAKLKNNSSYKKGGNFYRHITLNPIIRTNAK